jgi:hypothetical protein
VTTLSPARRLAAALDPVIKARHAGFECDPWQAQVLRSTAKRIIICASRQAGKSWCIGTLAIHTAETDPGEIIIGAPKQDQAAEMLRKAMGMYSVAGHWDEAEVDKESVLRVELRNGSRIIAVPGKAQTVRSFSALRMLILDEAAYVPDAFYQAVFPMLAVSGGRVVLLSTPHAKSGAFYDIWTEAPEWNCALPAEAQEEAWLKVLVPWWECPRIRPSFIEGERRFGDAYIDREFACRFADAITAAFRTEDIDAMARDDVEPWAIAGWAR